MTIYTGVLTAGQSVTLLEAMGILYFAFQVSSDTGDSATLQGSAVSPFNGSASAAITKGAGSGGVYVDGPNKPIKGMTVSCVQGTVNIEVGY